MDGWKVECLFLLLIDVVWIPKNLRLIYFFFFILSRYLDLFSSHCHISSVHANWIKISPCRSTFQYSKLLYCSKQIFKGEIPRLFSVQRMFYLRANMAKKLVENTLYVRRDVKTRKQGFHVVHTFLVCASSLTDSHTLR